MSPRLRVLTVAAIGLGLCLAACEAVEAGPKWRLRRWSNRAPIDPTIRSSVRFNGPQQRWPARTRTYSRAGVHVVIR